jgi:hypothetical protein
MFGPGAAGGAGGGGSRSKTTNRPPAVGVSGVEITAEFVSRADPAQTVAPHRPARQIVATSAQRPGNVRERAFVFEVNVEPVDGI